MTSKAKSWAFLCRFDVSCPDDPPTNIDLAQLQVQAVGETRRNSVHLHCEIGRVYKFSTKKSTVACSPGRPPAPKIDETLRQRSLEIFAPMRAGQAIQLWFENNLLAQQCLVSRT
jgi:hypothetical protein